MNIRLHYCILFMQSDLYIGIKGLDGKTILQDYHDSNFHEASLQLR
uniref:Uncharacterized protein n=1 Tax=Arundo donax TaxID=35708 RepID=A0A0A9GX21_ARUDO